VISKILSADAPPPRAHNPEIPLDLETVCRKAIERNPAHRYRSAAEFRDDLQSYLERRPIKASPAGLTERLRKYFGRHQLGSISMVASAAIAVAVALGWALYSKQHEVDTQTAAAVEAQEQADELLDMLTMVIPGGEAAGSMIEDLVETGQVISLTQEDEGAGGVTPEGASTPEGIARRASHDIYEALAPIDLPPAEDADAYRGIYRSALEMRKANPERALGHVNVYLDQHSDDFDALQLRAALHGQLQAYEEMVADAEQLVRIRSDSPVAYLWRGLARLLLGQASPGLEDLRRAEELEGIAAWARALQGIALIQTGRPADAIAALDGVLTSSPELIIAMLARASAYISMGDASAAMSDLNQVCELEQENAEAFAARGECYVALGDLDAAIADFDRAMAIGGRTQAMVIRYLAIKIQQRAAVSAAAAEAERARQADEASKEQVESWFSRWVYPRTPPEGG
jgi:tetratricopeptide (TPR) repeat protein